MTYKLEEHNQIVEISGKDLQILDCMLTVASMKPVIKKANFVDKRTGEMTNACFDFENFMFEKFGIFLKNNHLSEKNKAIIKNAEEKEE